MIIFRIKALIGKLLMEQHLKSMGNALSVKSKVFNGEVTIAWDEIQQGNRETIFFLHGLSDRKESFYYAAKKLSRNYNIVMPELPGFGSSEKQYDRRYGITEYVFWFKEFLTSLNVEKVHLVGNSLGGTISAHLAVELPEKVKSLTLVNAAGFVVDNNNTFYEEIFEGKSLFMIQSEQEYEIFRRRIFFKQAKLPYFVKEHLIKEMIDNRNWYQKIIHDIFPEESFDELIAKKPAIFLNDLCSEITVPVNIMWGKKDTLFPYPMADYAHKTINGSTLRYLENVGHCPQLENPKLFSNVLEELLSS